MANEKRETGASSTGEGVRGGTAGAGAGAGGGTTTSSFTAGADAAVADGVAEIREVQPAPGASGQNPIPQPGAGVSSQPQPAGTVAAPELASTQLTGTNATMAQPGAGEQLQGAGSAGIAVRLKKPHTDAGRDHQPGDVIRVDRATARFLMLNDIGEAIPEAEATAAVEAKATARTEAEEAVERALDAAEGKAPAASGPGASATEAATIDSPAQE
jgi:hypothetical protein